MLISQKNFCVNSNRVLRAGGFERAIASLAVKNRSIQSTRRQGSPDESRFLANE
jgi:hypothetical protein